MIEVEIGEAAVRHHMIPYRRLWGSVLLQAIKDYSAVIVKSSKKAQPLETNFDYYWIESDDEGPRSFVWVCQVLDLCPRMVRAEARKNWRKFVEKKEADRARLQAKKGAHLQAE